MANDDPGGQLNIHQQINDLLRDRQQMLLDQVDILGAQARAAREVCNGIDCENLEGMEQRLGGISDGLQEVRGRTDEMNDALEQGAENAEELSGNIIDVQNAAKMGAIAGFAGGLISGFTGVVGIAKNALSIVSTLLGTIAKVGMSILSIPFKILGGLVSMAQAGAGGGNALREAMEAVREEFGDLATNEGKAIVGTLSDLRGQMGNLAGTGLSVSRVFGLGREGMAAFLGQVSELAKAAGASFGLFQGELEKSGVALMMMQKGLGLTAETMAHIGAKAVNSGQTMKDAMLDFSRAAINAGKAHGMSSKVIAKGMGELVDDFETFGKMAPETMANVTVFTRKLGIEIKSLTGLIDGFDDFESAAKNSARLAQTFGMQVDAMKMMREQDPAKRLQMMQEAFKKTGKSIKGMTRQQMDLLASAANVDKKTAEMAFSQRGLSMSYDEVTKKTAKNKKGQLTQLEVMKELSKNIKRLVHSGSSQFTGFLDAFMKGFGKGIMRSAEMRKVLRNIYKALRIVYKAGRSVGRMFVKMFPGVKQLLGGLADIFEPRSFTQLMEGVKKAFKNLFIDLQHDPNSGIRPFLDRLGMLFKEFFMKKGPAAEAILSGGKTILKALSGIIGQLIRYIGPKIQEGINLITQFIANPDLSAFSGAAGFVSDLFMPIFEALVDVGPGIGDALVNLFSTAYELAKPHLMTALETLLKYLFGYFMVMVIASTVKGAVTGAIGAIIGNLAIGMKAATAAGAQPPGMLTMQMTETAALPANIIAQSAANIALMALILLPAIALAIVAVSYIMSLANMQTLPAAMLSLLAVSVSLGILGFAAAALGALPVPMVLMGVGAVVVLGLLLTALMAMLPGTLGAFQQAGITLATAMTFGATMAAVLASLLVIGLAAFGLGAITMMPGGIAIIIVGLIALNQLVDEVIRIADHFITVFGAADAGKLERAKIASEVTLNVVKAIFMATHAALSVGMANLYGSIITLGMGDSPLTKGLKAMTEVSELLRDVVPAIVKNMKKAVRGNPKTLQKAIQTIGDIMKAMQPLVDIVIAMADLAQGLASAPRGYLALDGDKISEIMGHVVGSVEPIMTQFKGFIDSLVNVIGAGMDQSKLNAIKAIAPLLEAAGTLLSSMIKPINELMKGSRKFSMEIVDDGILSDKLAKQDMGIDQAALKKGMTTLAESLPGFISGIGGGIKNLVQSLKEITVGPSDIDNLMRVIRIFGPLAKALVDFTNSLKTLMSLTAKMGADITSAYSVVKIMRTMSILLFGGQASKQVKTGQGFGAEYKTDYAATSGIFPLLIGFVSKLSQGLGGVQQIDLTTIEKGGKAINEALTIATRALNLIGKSLALFGLKGQLKDISPAKAKTMMRTVSTVIQEIRTQLTKTIRSIFSLVENLGGSGQVGQRKMRLVAARAKNLKSVLGVIDPVLSIITSMMTLDDHLSKRLPTKGQPKTGPRRLGFLQEFLNQNIDALFGEDGAIRKIMSRMVKMLGRKEFRNVRGIKGRANALKAAFEAVDTVMGVLLTVGSEQQGGAGGKGPAKSTLGTLQDGAKNLDTILHDFHLDSVFSYMQKDAIKKFPDTRMSKIASSRLKALSTVFKDFATMLGKVPDELKEPNTGANIYANIISIENALDKAARIKNVRAEFSGGEVKVRHKHENIKMKVDVYINADKLAHSLMGAKVRRAPYAGKRLSTEDF